ncbi:MAG TPA: redoxin family protein [Candidatus Sulfotelmatobacter sp.]|nr:redoxin family protein [Candidatus Sulfotelmatobacter sp.]
MRLLWVWFLAVMAFPIAQSAHPASPAGAGHPGHWNGPLKGVLNQLDWVGNRRAKESDLAGQVVVVEFWAFQCVNCQRSLPAVRQLSARYRDSDVRLIGIHTPELPDERVADNVTKAVARDSIDFPVALDPDGEAWEAIGNQYWPCFYVLDRAGKVSYKHVGELHQGTPGWDEFVKRIEAARAASS